MVSKKKSDNSSPKYWQLIYPLHIGHPGVRSRYATLTILVSPDPPIISQGDYLETTEDREIELECISANGKPAAEVYPLNKHFK